MDKKSVKLNQNILFTNVDTKLLVNCQGVLIIKNKNYLTQCTIYFYNKDNTYGLKLEFSLTVYINASLFIFLFAILFSLSNKIISIHSLVII